MTHMARVDHSSSSASVSPVALPPPVARDSIPVPRPLELRERSQAIPTEPDSTYLDLECLAEISPEPFDPLWGAVIARGAVTVLAGEPGAGKSYVALDLAASVTRGDLGPRRTAADEGQPQSPGKPQGVLICSPHYERGSTLMRRLVAAKANLSLIQTIHGVRQADDFHKQGPCWSFQLDRDLAILEQELMFLKGDATDIGLIVIDPFPLGMSGSGARQARQLQELTSRLAEIASLFQVAVLLVCEGLPLSDSKRATSTTPYPTVERIAQSVWVVERDSKAPARRLLLPAKLMDETASPGLAFGWHEGAIEWESESIFMTAQEFRTASLQRARNPLLLEDASELSRAMDWLQARLADGPVQSWFVKQEAHDNEISYATLRRAFCALRIESNRVDRTRHHAWAIAGSSHARRMTGAECSDRSRDVKFEEMDEGDRATFSTTASAEASCLGDTQVAETAACNSSVDGVKVWESDSRTIGAHPESVLEHQLEHGLHSVNHEVLDDFPIGVHSVQQMSGKHRRDEPLVMVSE